MQDSNCVQQRFNAKTWHARKSETRYMYIYILMGYLEGYLVVSQVAQCQFTRTLSLFTLFTHGANSPGELTTVRADRLSVRDWIWASCRLDFQPVRNQWEYPRKLEGHSPIKPGQPRRRLIPFLFWPFPNSLHKWREVGQWTGLSTWNSKFRLEHSDRNIRDHSQRLSWIFPSEGKETDLSILLPKLQES